MKITDGLFCGSV